MLGQVKESLKKFRLARLSVPNFSFLAYLEVSRLVKLARLARLVRVGELGYTSLVSVCAKFQLSSMSRSGFAS